MIKKLQPRAIKNHLSDQENYRKQKKMNNLSIQDFLCFILQLFFLLKLKYREIVMKEL